MKFKPLPGFKPQRPPQEERPKREAPPSAGVGVGKPARPRPKAGGFDAKKAKGPKAEKVTRGAPRRPAKLGKSEGETATTTTTTTTTRGGKRERDDGADAEKQTTKKPRTAARQKKKKPSTGGAGAPQPPRPAADSNWKQLLAKTNETPAPKKLPGKGGKATAPTPTSTTPSNAKPLLESKYIALDCEMVGVGPHRKSHVARVYLLDEHGRTVLDEYVKPTEEVTDFRTQWSGIEPHHLRLGASLESVRAKVLSHIAGKIVVGHDLGHDFEVLGISHPKSLIRDTAQYRPLQQVIESRDGKTHLKPRKLKDLVLEHLAREIQYGRRGHDPHEDAKAALDLYMSLRGKWELSLSQ